MYILNHFSFRNNNCLMFKGYPFKKKVDVKTAFLIPALVKIREFRAIILLPKCKPEDVQLIRNALHIILCLLARPFKTLLSAVWEGPIAGAGNCPTCWSILCSRAPLSLGSNALLGWELSEVLKHPGAGGFTALLWLVSKEKLFHGTETAFTPWSPRQW